MKILHTSDWHIGRSLYGRKRYAEFKAFLDWLAQTIEENQVDILLIAGDVFDTATPSNLAQELYYRFLCRVSNSCCRHVVITGGNHDSPSFLNAPKELLHFLHVYVVGSSTENLEDEVFTLYQEDTPEAIICAVPYLRDKDIRTAEPGETLEDKNQKLITGIKKHYEEVCSIAENKQKDLVQKGHATIPIIAMGHLFTAGGKKMEEDGVRDLYIGNLAHVTAEVFPPSIDYLALGHLHVPQIVGGKEHFRYCGSPIPMGFGEAKQQKQVVLLGFEQDKNFQIQSIPIPCFQKLVRIVGDLETILTKLENLQAEDSDAWLEIEYEGKELIPDLQAQLEAKIEDTKLEIRRIKNRPAINQILQKITEEETLDDLDYNDVFQRRLNTMEFSDEEKTELTATYQEIIQSMNEEDLNAE